MAASHRPLSLPGWTARSARPAYAGTGAPRPNSRPWGIDAILARAAGRLGRGIATLAPFGALLWRIERWPIFHHAVGEAFGDAIEWVGELRIAIGESTHIGHEVRARA